MLEEFFKDGAAGNVFHVLLSRCKAMQEALPDMQADIRAKLAALCLATALQQSCAKAWVSQPALQAFVLTSPRRLCTTCP